jgi:hypothetical protein
MSNDFKPRGRAIHDQSYFQLLKGVPMLKLKQIAIAMMLALPYASAQSTEAVNPGEFNQLQTKVDAIQDSMEVSGLKGLRISGGIDPVYIYNRAKGTASFAFLNNFSSINGSGEFYSYDNSYFGMAYLDIQKEMDDGGTKMRLTLEPSKSSGSQYNFGNIVHEASASIPLDGLSTRLIVGQMPDVSGYEPFINGFAGANNITSNQLYPGFGEFFITKNMLFDFAAATFYTGAGVDLVRGPWETKFILANFNSARNDCPVTAVGAGAGPCKGSSKSPTFIYNATYAKEEYWGFEFTGYDGVVSNWNAGGVSRLDQFEIDGWYTRADFNTNLQYTVGRQKGAANNHNGDAGWWGISSLVSERLTPRLTLAGRFDYLNNEKNGGGTFNTYDSNYCNSAINTAMGGTTACDGTGTAPGTGDSINGFGAGDPNAAGYDANKGANRYELSLSATYRLTRYVALRGELRHDVATTAAFYNFNDGTFQKTNDTIGLQTIVNF